jgi:hypothetical protein
MTNQRITIPPDEPSTWEKIKFKFFSVAEAMDGDGPELHLVHRVSQLEARVSELEANKFESDVISKLAAVS